MTGERSDPEELVPTNHRGGAADETVAERYELGPAIEHAGPVTAYRARDRHGEREVVVTRGASDAGGPARRVPTDGLRLLTELDHPGLVPTLDVGREHGRPYLVTPPVDGPSLTERLADGPLAVSDAVELGRHLASALRYLHARGLAHRGLGPAAVVLDGSGRPLLAGVGVALLAGDPATAPDGVDDGPAADVYALGVVLLESVTGQRAEPGVGVAVPRDLPGGASAVLERMTAPDAADRPDARAVVGELAAVADRIDGRVTLSAGAVPAVPGAVGGGRRPSRRALALGAAAVALVVVGGVLGELALPGAPEPAASAAAVAAPAPRSPVAVGPPLVPDSSGTVPSSPAVPDPAVPDSDVPGSDVPGSDVPAPASTPMDVPVPRHESPSSSTTDGDDGDRGDGGDDGGSRDDGSGRGQHGKGSDDARRGHHGSDDDRQNDSDRRSEDTRNS